MSNIFELGQNVESIEAAADALILGYKSAFKEGLSKEEVRASFEEDPKSHEDIFMVLLGMKPAAGRLGNQFQLYFTRGRDYMAPIALNSTVPILYHDAGYIWNPKMVKEVLSDPEISATKEDVFSRPEFVIPSKIFPPEKRGFAFIVALLASEQSPGSPYALEGALYGYPISDVLEFAENSPAMHMLRQNPRTPHEELSGKFVDYLRRKRSANVPGFSYFTTRVENLPEEVEKRRLYQKSGINDKFRRILGN